MLAQVTGWSPEPCTVALTLTGLEQGTGPVASRGPCQPKLPWNGFHPNPNASQLRLYLVNWRRAAPEAKHGLWPACCLLGPALRLWSPDLLPSLPVHSLYLFQVLFCPRCTTFPLPLALSLWEKLKKALVWDEVQQDLIKTSSFV